MNFYGGCDAGASGQQGEDRERANTISEEDWE